MQLSGLCPADCLFKDTLHIEKYLYANEHFSKNKSDFAIIPEDPSPWYWIL